MRLKEVILGYIHDIIGNSIYDILKFLAGTLITTIISGGTIGILLRKYLSNVYLIAVLIFATVIASLLSFFIVYRAYRKNKYRILSMKINFEYAGEKVIVTSTITVKALRNGLDSIYNRYTWYEDERSKVRCLSKGHKIRRLPRKDISYEYDVLFGKTLKRGEEITFITRVENTNVNGHFLNFYSREIITPIDFLSITVVIPSKYKIKEIYRTVIKGSAYSDFSSKKAFPFQNSHTWEIPKKDLHIGWEYKISW